MATNTTASVDLARKIILKPVLKDANGKTMDWETAKKEFNAVTNWPALQNENVGTLTKQADGTAIFTPVAEGEVTVDCFVGLKDPVTGEPGATVDAGVDITVTAA